MVDSILGSDGKQVFADEDILNVFTGDSCPQLKTKPKLVFFQACRGGWFSTDILITRWAAITNVGYQASPTLVRALHYDSPV